VSQLIFCMNSGARPSLVIHSVSALLPGAPMWPLEMMNMTKPSRHFHSLFCLDHLTPESIWDEPARLGLNLARFQYCWFCRLTMASCVLADTSHPLALSGELAMVAALSGWLKPPPARHEETPGGSWDKPGTVLVARHVHVAA